MSHPLPAIMTPPRILIVEDETIVAMDIQRGLKNLGYEVVAATGTGTQAVHLAREHQPDLVLMDIRLQGPIDGVEAACQIRSQLRLSIIFLTAYADRTTVQRAKAAEPFGYLLKPFDDQELHTTIEIALHKRAAEQLALENAGEALRQSEARFHLLVDNLQDYAVVLLDPQGRIVSWNPGAEHINGYTEAEIIGQHCSVLYCPEDIVRNKPDKVLWIASHEGRARDDGWRVRKNGSPYWADVVVTALRDKQGHLAGFAKIVRDITEKKKAEEDIRKLNASLEQRVQERTTELNAANKELEAFTYSVAHDLRAPLRGLLGFLGILQEEVRPRLSPEETQHLDRSVNCAQRMSSLIEDLLKLSRIGRRPLECRPVPLASLLDEVRAELQPEIQNRQVTWLLETLPTVDCDPGLIRQVFINLLSNALKDTAQRQPATIQVGQIERDGETIFFVRDNGVGFNMKHAAKLFQPFSRLHAAEDFQGSGIGLAIVERIVRKHSGRIWAEAAENEGATFFFTISPRKSRPPGLSEDLNLSEPGTSEFSPQPTARAA